MCSTASLRLIRDRTKQLALSIAGIGEQRKGLIGVSGEHDRVEAVYRSARPDRDVFAERARPIAPGSRATPRPRSESRIASTYTREPPVTVRHCGRLRKPRTPWLSKNSSRKRAGNVHICSGSADHTAEACGTISRSTKPSE